MQTDFFASGKLSLPPNGIPSLSAGSALPLQRQVTLRETPFTYRLPLRDLRSAAGEVYGNLLMELRAVGLFHIRQSENRGRTYRQVALDLSRLVDASAPDGGELEIPKGQHARIMAILFRYMIAPHFTLLPPVPEPLIETLSCPFRNGTQLDPIQHGVLVNAFSGLGGRIINFGMGGGKSLLIAATLRAFPGLRPAVVTGENSTDSAQLALTLANCLNERVCLLGCANSLPAAVRRMSLVPEQGWRTASIVVGTHRLLHQVQTPVTLGERPSASEREVHPPTELGLALAQAPLLIADEVDTLATLKTLSHLLGMSPQRVYGFTGTWGRRPDRTEAVLLSLLSTESASTLVIDAGHKAVAESGRIVNAAIHGYEFSSEDYPRENMPDFRNSILLRHVVTHSGRNRFCGELLVHVLGLAGEDHGTAVAFVKTIEHGRAVLREFCLVHGLPYEEMALREAGIILHHAQLPGAKKVRNVEALRSGNLRLVICTDALAVGVDCANITDVVDLTGMQEERRSLQRSGRSLRRCAGKLIARYHFIADTHFPALAAISHRKRKALEEYFGRSAVMHSRARLPWRMALVDQLTDASIETELNAL